MSYTKWTDEEVSHARNLRDEGLTARYIADELNHLFHLDADVRTASKVSDMFRKGLGQGPPVDTTREKQEWGPDGSTVTTGNRAYSDEEMAEMFGVDMNLWHVTKRVTNVWGQNTQTKLWWAPNELEILTAGWAEMLDEVRHETTPLAYPVRDEEFASPMLYQINLFDAHIGMKAWGPETGEDYDLYIAIRRYEEAFMRLLHEAPEHSRILLPIGQDLFHFDTLIQGKAGATAKGTPQDVDSRWQKLFIATTKMLTGCIEAADRTGQPRHPDNLLRRAVPPGLLRWPQPERTGRHPPACPLRRNAQDAEVLLLR
jgi:hypothetical protein